MAAEPGIADRLADGPVTVDDLAAAMGAHRDSLYRVLRMLAGAGVFREEAAGRFGLTPLGGTLRSEGPDSVRDWALYVGPGALGGLGPAARNGHDRRARLRARARHANL